MTESDALHAYARALFRDDDAEPITPPAPPQQPTEDPTRDFIRGLFTQE